MVSLFGNKKGGVNLLIDKYDDYPVGISEKDIIDADESKLARIIEIYTNEFLIAVKRETSKIEELSEQINRYQIFSNLLINSLKDWCSEKLSDSEKTLQASIYLGSMLEGSLQMFLYVFKNDYLNARWKEWYNIDDEGGAKSVDIEKIKKDITEVLNQLVANKTINPKQKNSLKCIIYQELNIRENGKPIDRIMLDELIRLFEHEEILEKKKTTDDNSSFKDIISKMDNIKKGRNSIHIFAKEVLVSQEELLKRIRDYCFIMKDLLFRIQCCDNEARKEAIMEMLLENTNVGFIMMDDDYNIVKTYGSIPTDFTSES